MSERPAETPDTDEGVMGLTEVDPSPVEETPVEFKGDYFPSSPPRSVSPLSSTLGLGNHGPAYYREYRVHSILALADYKKCNECRNTPHMHSPSSLRSTSRTHP
jgi:hypothetical protein